MGTRGAWSRDFLLALGNSNPSAATVNLVSAWTKAEGTAAQYNPLATTLDYGSNTLFNHLGPNSGVRNYSTRQEGIEATVITLRGNHIGYRDVLTGLQTNNPELALSGMLTPLMPWGTNFGTVQLYYRSKDVTAEPLASEQGKIDTQTSSISTHTTNKVDDSNKHYGTEKPATQPIASNGDVTGEDIQRIGKILLGSVVAVVGSILIIKSFVTFDMVKSVVKEAL